MAKLLIVDSRFWHFANTEGVHAPKDQTAFRLYCLPCKENHEIVLADVEKIVYALQADVLVSYGVGSDDPEFGAAASEGEPECLKLTLRGADDVEAWAEQVEQGITCRKAAP